MSVDSALPPSLASSPHSNSNPPQSHPYLGSDLISSLRDILEILVHPLRNFLCWCTESGVEYVLFVYSAVLVRFVLVGHPYHHCAEVESQGITDSDTRGEEILLCLKRDAVSKIKIIGTLLSLSFVLMQAFGSDPWASLSAGIYASTTSLFMSILLYILAFWWYEAILQSGKAGQWFYHAHDMTGTPSSLDPWVALSIPFAWMFWSFILLFSVTVMSAWDSPSSVSVPPASTGPHIPRAGHSERKGAVLTVLTLGLACCVTVSITWSRYVSPHHRWAGVGTGMF